MCIYILNEFNYIIYARLRNNGNLIYGVNKIEILNNVILFF